MLVNAENLAACKQYMRIDDTADDVIIEALYSAAVLYLDRAGVTQPPDGEDASLYNLAVWSLTLHYYDHRDAVGTESSIPTGLRPIINQLQLTAAAANSVGN